MINTGRVGLGPPNDYGGAQPHPTILLMMKSAAKRLASKNLVKAEKNKK